MKLCKVIIELIDITGIKRSFWHFFSDYILFLDNKLFALIRGLIFTLLTGKYSFVFVYKNCDFYSFGNIRLGKNVVISKGCRINGPLEIDENTTIGEKVVLTGPIKIGKSCLINYGAWIDRYVEFEDGSGVAHNSLLISFSHDISNPLARGFGETYYKPIRVLRGAWMGANVVVLKGVTVGEGAIVSAGAVVTKDIPPHVLAAGNPCRILKQLSIE